MKIVNYKNGKYNIQDNKGNLISEKGFYYIYDYGKQYALVQLKSSNINKLWGLFFLCLPFIVLPFIIGIIIRFLFGEVIINDIYTTLILIFSFILTGKLLSIFSSYKNNTYNFIDKNGHIICKENFNNVYNDFSYFFNSICYGNYFLNNIGINDNEKNDFINYLNKRYLLISRLEGINETEKYNIIDINSKETIFNNWVNEYNINFLSIINTFREFKKLKL